MFAPNYKELVSAHGYAHNNVVIWKYPSLTRVAELNGKLFIFVWIGSVLHTIYFKGNIQ